MADAVKSKKSPLNNYYVRIVGTLLVITAVVGILLALVNMLTAPVIAHRADGKKTEAMSQVMEGLDGFDPLDVPEGMKDVKEIVRAKKGDAVLGYCVQTGTMGNDGEIQLMVGITSDGAVTSVAILDQSETMYTDKHGELVAQFPGKSDSVALSQDGGDISAISGATISSRAITKGVNSALQAAKVYMEGGAQ